MFTQVNSTLGVQKTLAKPIGVNNLLSVALNRISGGLTADRSREDAADSDISKSRNRDFSGIRLRPNAAYDPTGADHSDKIVASVGGMARMGGLFEKADSPQEIDPEVVGDRLVKAKREIVLKPVSALDAQANQSPEFVMKLLE
jgi:hypothetical protein